ncbi:Arm DNA-binding domain-containing protein [Thalassotalea sp. ND16A]
MADRDGLSIRVSTTGTLTFEYRYRFHDKPARLSLGRYQAMTLA